MDPGSPSGDASVVLDNAQQPSSLSPSTPDPPAVSTIQTADDDSSPTSYTDSTAQEQQPPSESPPVEEPMPEDSSRSSEPSTQPPAIEHAYWAEFEEDTSVPSESEMKDIEAAADEDHCSLDYDYWEKSFYPDLDDTEYRPVEKARLSWKFKGVRGNKDCPNRAKVMRSPSAYIGGCWWSIKFFPRGNKVSSLSVYLECLPTIPNPDKIMPESEFKILRGNPDAVLKDCHPELDMSYDKTDDPTAWLNHYKSQYPPATSQDSSPKVSWRISAQIGVILYNPNEPRTGWAKKSCHQFNPHNPDWGWTNFHGPWDEIHRRQQGQRQALLRNDTLAFDVYIRIIDDPTRSLWWHDSETEPTWDSLGLTGYRPLGDSSINHCAEVAGLASWLHLAPFCKIIQSVDVLEHLTNCDVKPKPLCDALQRILWQLRSRSESLQYVDTNAITSTLRNLHEYSGDVSEFWERLRRCLELELAGTDAGKEFAKLFDSPNSCSASGAVNNTLPRDFNSRIYIPADQAKTMRDALGWYLGAKPGRWALPPVLHVELGRQKLDGTSRQWQLLYNRVDLDEDLDLAQWVPRDQCGLYVLYGYVVHRGQRTSGKFFSILRPGGPGTRWLAFDDGSDNHVECLTRKTALGPHLGLDPSSKPDHKTGHDVAVSVLYIRSDVVGDFLPGPQGPWHVPKPMQEYYESGTYPFTKRLDEKTGQVDLPVEVYSLSQYDDMGSLFDSYDLMCRAKSSRNVMYLTMPRSSTYVDLRKKIALWKSSGCSIPSEHVRLWQIGHTRKRYAPTLAFSRISNLDGTLDLPCGIARFWLQVVSGDDAKEFAMPDPPKKAVSEQKPEEAVVERTGSESSEERQPTPEVDEERTAPTSAEANADVPANEQSPSEGETSNSNAEPSTPNPTSSTPDLPNAANFNSDNDAINTNDVRELDPAAPVEAQHEPSSDPRRALNQLQEPQQEPQQEQPVSSTDPPNPPNQSAGPAISLLLVQEPPSENPIPPVAHDAEPAVPAPEVRLPVDHIYYFIQIFDADKQVLKTVGAFFSRNDESIKAAIRKHLEWPDKKDFFIWKRVDGTTVTAILAGETFGVCKADGVCIIIADKLNKDKQIELHQAGLFITPDRLVQYLWASSRQHPTKAFTGRTTMEPTFTGDYYSGEVNKGFYHGRGKHISDQAAIYEGDFLFGLCHGKGFMEYPSGDTYDGDWFNDQRHGQGTFIERKTGNKYVGGYREGKRHGKGVTYWEVADEEMELCQICYGEEQDALFFDCGHVCACVACARQVDICPICRKSILSVVKIYRS